MNHSPLFILAPLAALALSGCSEVPAPQADKSPRPVQIIKLGPPTQHYMKRFSGTLEAADTANLAFKVPGTIEQVLVKTGDRVTKGEIIARLDPHDYQVTVIELEARLEEAKAAQALATIELSRVKQATGDNAIAAVNLDRAMSGYKRSNAMVKVVEQNLQKAKDALSYTELKAPFGGVIGQRFSEQFEQAAPGLPVFTLHQPDKLQAVIDVPENLVAGFNDNPYATISWYGAQQPVSAQLKEVSTLPDPIKQTYTLTYLLNGTSTDLLPGKAIQLELPFVPKQKGYCIPYSALVENSSGPAVFVVKSGKAMPTSVEVTSVHANKACITGELRQGTQIITAGTHYLKPGQLVGTTQTSVAVQ
ncbi:efflux RND transporter periplasmic adaptor subunit [Photobacterium sp. SDRW27]|uniref:efflux RND transporter periplasmic adaptor subunit n=1 Tax=Photobacterium obscurum TaxID=2829490 RepID=UPI0022438070|nr:efflux RND transporter periplasmic adaptor subunit [Photobacterium obscurum]MCW8328389.1 efflux RND transporter periplasmic adaptor subunit [Photobacterium obscurum]